MMRAISALVFLAVALLLVMGYQAARQELAIRTYMTRLHRAKKLVQFNEKEIVAAKVKLDALRNTINSLKTNQDDLMAQMHVAEKQQENSENTLKNCKEVKDAKENKKTEITDIVNKMKETQEAERAKAQLEVQNLKQHILDRDKAVCAFLDTQHAEGRKLCGV